MEITIGVITGVFCGACNRDGTKSYVNMTKPVDDGFNWKCSHCGRHGHGLIAQRERLPQTWEIGFVP